MRSFVALLLLSLSGCCFGVWQSDIDAWKGKPVAALEAHELWGVPQSKVDLSDGSTAYNYLNEGTQVINGVGHHRACQNSFIVKDGIVTDWRLKGHCCTSSSCRPES